MADVAAIPWVPRASGYDLTNRQTNKTLAARPIGDLQPSHCKFTSQRAMIGSSGASIRRCGAWRKANTANVRATRNSQLGNLRRQQRYGGGVRKLLGAEGVGDESMGCGERPFFPFSLHSVDSCTLNERADI